MKCSVVAVTPLGRTTLLTIAFPTPNEAPSIAGRFFMARCVDGAPLERSWEPYLRRMLHPVAYVVQEGAPLYTLLVPASDDPGNRWLALRTAGDDVDLLGPAGNGFAVDLRSRALLLVADQVRAPLLYPLMHSMLDRGGRVSLLIRGEADPQASALPLDTLLQRLPLAVEARAEPARTFVDALAELAPWADHLCLSFESSDPTRYADVARVLRATRLRLDPGFAQVLWPGEIPCGVGACLACLAPLASGGFTRACVNGPVMDLTRIATA